MSTVVLPHCELDLDHGVVRRHGEVVPLTPMEAAVLRYLLGREGQTVSRGDLLEDVWGYHRGSSSQTVAVVLRRLRAKIEADPSQPRVLRTVRGVGWALHLPRGDAPPPPAPAPTNTNLVAEREPFFGRTAELAALLQPRRLTTLLGPPGAGKTRLAREAARQALRGPVGEAWFVDLAAAGSVDDLVVACFRTLGLPVPHDLRDAPAALGDALRHRSKCWIILDNLEQLVPACRPALHQWLDLAPDVTWIVTSRVRAGVRGEIVAPIGPLEPNDAEAMLVDRIEARVGPLSAGEARGDMLNAIVELLGYSPLAVELAAARVDVLGVAGLLAALGDRFAALRDPAHVPARHAALDVAIAWSWESLPPWLQAVFAQTGVFHGGFTLEAARAVLDPGEDRDVDEAIAGLLDRSLLRRWAVVGEAKIRFRSEVSLAEWAAARLAERPDCDGVGRRHAEHYAAFGDSGAIDRLQRREGRAAVEDLPNLRAAGAWARDHGAWETAALVSLGHLEVTGIAGPVLDGVEAGRALFDEPRVPAPLRGRLAMRLVPALREAGVADQALDVIAAGEALAREIGARSVLSAMLTERATLLAHSDPASAEGLLNESLAIDRTQRNGGDVAVNLLNLATVLWSVGRLDEAESHAREALAIARSEGRRQLEIGALERLAMVAQRRGDLHGARALSSSVRGLAVALSERPAQAHACLRIGDIDRQLGQLASAAEHLGEAVTAFREYGARGPAAVALGSQALVHLDLGELDRARQELEEAIAELERLGWVAAEGRYLACLGEVRARQGHLDEGRRLAEQGVERMRESGDLQLYTALADAGRLAFLAGDREAAAERLAEAEGILAEAGIVGEGSSVAELRDQLQRG